MFAKFKLFFGHENHENHVWNFFLLWFLVKREMYCSIYQKSRRNTIYISAWRIVRHWANCSYYFHFRTTFFNSSNPKNLIKRISTIKFLRIGSTKGKNRYFLHPVHMMAFNLAWFKMNSQMLSIYQMFQTQQEYIYSTARFITNSIFRFIRA